MPTRSRPARSAPPAPAVLLRRLPQIDDLLRRDALAALVERHGRRLVTALLRREVEALRRRVRGGSVREEDLPGEVEALAGVIAVEAAARTTPSLRPVINATGVVLHTNLGRAPLSEAAARRVYDIAGAYSTLEYDQERGRRGTRLAQLGHLLELLFPDSAAHVVNNCAAAVLLALNTLAEGREVVVSRGELVEIGGSFRIPDIMRKSGALLREVGTTNRTRLRDYERAIGPRTGLLLKVHPSNYRIVGFTAQATLQEVAALGRRRRIPIMLDQGSGNLTDLRTQGLAGEPTVYEALADGADLVTCSGDKLLGGPQAGLLIGRPALIRRVRDNPLSRALRIDKMTVAALEITLGEHLRDRARDTLPVLVMTTMTQEAIEGRARRVLEAVGTRAPSLRLAVIPGASVTGGGAAPGEGLKTALIAISSLRLSARQLEERLRRFQPPVIARIETGKVLLDLRTVLPGQDATLAEVLRAIGGE
jgi:L-seryl-tRNA(Ser) seleniumtransferase